MWFPGARDPLATRRGRLATLFGLYLSEGIPLGFTATAIATQMRRQGVGPAEVGAFVASLYLPWSWKWAAGPFVDVFSSDRLGRRRAWIVGAQLLMAATLLAALPVDFAASLGLFTALILVHNIFAATQDVAIDALAVGILRDDERGLANGLMFGAAYLGQAIGGSGVLFLTPHIGFRATFLFVAATLLAITLFVALPIREPPSAMPRIGEGPRLRAVGRELARFVRDSVRAFLGTRAAFVGLIFALLPAGAYALALALQSNLAVELGMSDSSVATLGLWSTVLSASGCVAGGWLSDRLGRRRTLAVAIAATTIPNLFLAVAMRQHGWLVPVDPSAAGRPLAPDSLLRAFWITTLCYAVFQGFLYGTWIALFMDITNPAVAATQFTAYMALSNLVIAYSAAWQGQAVGSWGWSYPRTLVTDSIFGLLGIALLPLMGLRSSKRPREEAAGAPR